MNQKFNAEFIERRMKEHKLWQKEEAAKLTKQIHTAMLMAKERGTRIKS